MKKIAKLFVYALITALLLTACGGAGNNADHTNAGEEEVVVDAVGIFTAKLDDPTKLAAYFTPFDSNKKITATADALQCQ